MNLESQSAPDHRDPPDASSAKKEGANRAWMFVMLAISLVVIGRWIRDSWPISPAIVPSLRAPEFGNISALDPGAVAGIDAWLADQVARAAYPSLSVALVRNGEVAYQRAFGYENLKERTKAAPETSYHVASVTKAFTGALAVMLHDRGIIDLDQPAVKYLPPDVAISDTPERGAAITIRQLASHTSGLPRGIPGPVQSVEGRYALEPSRLHEFLAGTQLEFEPGADERYSNLGFGLLGYILERATGQQYESLLQEMIAQPLGLKGTAIHPRDDFRMATGYSSGMSRREQGHSFRRRLAASGGLVASAPDLARFLAAHMKPGLLTPAMLRELHATTRLADGSSSGNTVGWNESKISNGRVRILEKNGGRNNCSAWMGFAPDQGVGVAVITNCGEPSVDPIGRWLLERCLPDQSSPKP